ncbi:MAG: hypothetical protein OXC31_22425 [Spirochaetaceae bacterium]|nr:hypothetical protein [Spirochaetaceae bacterium]
MAWSFQSALVFSIMALTFGFLVFLVMAFLISRGLSPQAVLRICALPLIIISAVFLVIVGYSEAQIAPILSLLSAIAGYLLGRHDNDSGEQKPTG